MRLFFSWQSDLAEERKFIRKCLQEVCDELDVEYDEDTRDNGSAEFVADVLLRKIRNSTIFVADITPVGITPSGKKLSNPNVCFETGFAECYHSRSQLILTYNEERAGFEDLPFDLSKRVSVRFKLSEVGDKGRRNAYKTQLKKTVSRALTKQEAEKKPIILNKYEKSLLFWSYVKGDGYISNVSAPMHDMGMDDKFIVPGKYTMVRFGFEMEQYAYSTPDDLKEEVRYERGLGTLAQKGLLASRINNHQTFWILTEEGEDVASTIVEEEVFSLVEFIA